ncbi:MAG TPA: hypothetical protein VLN45_05040 [Ignavibacteriaceae bacterium]|nr:hypothetical protein [Ignavibacteriaceae bacterium]
MKTFFLIFLAAFFTGQLSAQNISYTNTGNTNNHLFYADLIGKTVNLKGDLGLLGGMRAGYNLSENLSLGLVAHGLIPEKLGKSYINQKGRDELHLGYGGAEVSYKYNLSDNLYLTGMTMIGAGRVDYEILSGNDYFFIVEPGASINYMFTNYFGLGYSLNYRVASGVKYADLSDASLSGWSMALDFKFGFNIF